MPRRSGEGGSCRRHPVNLDRLPGGPRRVPAPGPCRRERPGAAIGCGRHRSVGEAERKWRPRLCTNHVRPAGECHPAPTAGSEGAGRAFPSPPRRRRRAPSPPQGTPALAPALPGAARSPEAPCPHLARSAAEAGQAQRARPAGGAGGGPEAPGARPRPGQTTRPRGALPSRAPGQVQRQSPRAPRALAGGKEDAASLPSGGGPAPRKPGAAARPGAQPRAPDAAARRPRPLPGAGRVGEPPGSAAGRPFQVCSRRGAGSWRTAGARLFTLAAAAGEAPPPAPRRTCSPPSGLLAAAACKHTHTHTQTRQFGFSMRPGSSGPAPRHTTPEVRNHTEQLWVRGATSSHLQIQK